MTTVEFEIAGLNDALKRASRIAPTKGRNLDALAGLYFEVCPETESSEATVILRATNGDVFYREWVIPDLVEGERVDWRLPSILVAGVVNAMPQSKRVVFSDEHADAGRFEIRCGKTKAVCRKIPTESFPEWEYLDHDELTQVTGFGERLEQVGWAVGQDPPLNGIHITGEEMIATDKYRLARTPMDISIISEPITVPASVLAPIVKHVVDTKLAVIDGHLCMMPNDRTEIMCTIFGDDFPNVGRIINTEFDSFAMFDKEQMKGMLERVMAAKSTDRQVGLRVIVGESELEVMIVDDDQEIGDSMYLEGQCDHPKVKYEFTPHNFIEAVTKAPGAQVMFSYTPSNPKKIVKFESSDDYEVWVAPRQVGAAQ